MDDQQPVSEQPTIAVTLPDGSTRALAAGSTALDLANDIGRRLGKDAVIAVVDGVERDLDVELHVGEHELRGRLIPPTVADIELRWPGGSAVAVADHRGGFSMAAVPRGPVSLRCERGPAAPSPVVTDWVTL